MVLRSLQLNGAGNGNTGIRVLSAGAVVVDDVNVHGFDTGIETFAGATIVNRGTFSLNRAVAVHGRGGTLTVEGSIISANNVGVQASGAGTVRLSNNGIYNNLTGFGCGGGTLASAGNNRKAGNTGGAVPTCAPTVAITIQ